MAQLLRILAALAEDPSLVPRTHNEKLTITCKPRNQLLEPSHPLMASPGMGAFTHGNIYIPTTSSFKINLLKVTKQNALGELTIVHWAVM